MRCIWYEPSGSARRRFSGIALAVALCSLSACAQSVSYENRSNIGAASPRQVAAAPRQVLEKDGLPAQSPPRLRGRQGVDDPSEPFSPSYGPAQFRYDRPTWQTTVVHHAPFSEAEIEAIIARAVVIQELREMDVHQLW